MKAAMGLLDKGFSVSGAAMFRESLCWRRAGRNCAAYVAAKVGVVLQNPMTCFDPLYRIGTQIA